MEKNTKQRLFEVMGKLDKKFKSNLNEGNPISSKMSQAGFTGEFDEGLIQERLTTFASDIHRVIGQLPDLRRLDLWSTANGIVGLYRYEPDGNAYEIEIRPVQTGRHKELWGDKIKKREERTAIQKEGLKSNLNEEFHTTIEYTREIEPDDIYWIYQKKYGTEAVDALPEFPEVLEFTINAEISQDYAVKPGTESDSVAYLYVSDMKLVDGSYLPEYKKYIEEWMNDNYKKLDSEIIKAYRNNQDRYSDY